MILVFFFVFFLAMVLILFSVLVLVRLVLDLVFVRMLAWSLILVIVRCYFGPASIVFVEEIVQFGLNKLF